MKKSIENNIVDLASKELRQFKDELQGLPKLALNKLELDASWDEIRAGVAEVESKNYFKSSIVAWTSIAACMAIATVLFFMNNQNVITDNLMIENSVAHNDASDESGTDLVNNILMLKEFNRTMENRLEALPEQPRLVRANTIDTITRLEDQIAFLDYRLDMQEHEPLSEEEYRILWQQRAKSMNGLYQVKVAQVQRAPQAQPTYERVAYYE